MRNSTLLTKSDALTKDLTSLDTKFTSFFNNIDNELGETVMVY